MCAAGERSGCEELVSDVPIVTLKILLPVPGYHLPRLASGPMSSFYTRLKGILQLQTHIIIASY